YVPFEQFSHIEYLTEGGFSKMVQLIHGTQKSNILIDVKIVKLFLKILTILNTSAKFDLAQMLASIVEGIMEIHKSDVIHRDFHSGNILTKKTDFNITGNAMICDFGISEPADISDNDDD
ncbi:30986_t:CDS:2, partial [Racocetra persica]